MNSGQYECEGHIVSFLVEDNNVIINTIYEAQQTVSEHTFELDEFTATRYQDKLISLGYDKVS